MCTAQELYAKFLGNGGHLTSIYCKQNSLDRAVYLIFVFSLVPSPIKKTKCRVLRFLGDCSAI